MRGRGLYLEGILSIVPGGLKKYPCLIKPQMHNKREIFKTEIFLDC